MPFRAVYDAVFSATWLTTCACVRAGCTTTATRSRSASRSCTTVVRECVVYGRDDSAARGCGAKCASAHKMRSPRRARADKDHEWSFYTLGLYITCAHAHFLRRNTCTRGGFALCALAKRDCECAYTPVDAREVCVETHTSYLCACARFMCVNVRLPVVFCLLPPPVCSDVFV